MLSIALIVVVGVAVFYYFSGGGKTTTISATATSLSSSGTSSPVTTPLTLVTSDGTRRLVVFCAGSLYIPLRKLKEIFEERYPGVEVVIEPSGSVKAVRKVTDLNRRCDVLALADYRLIPKYMMPKYAKWYIAFATNAVVLCYTDKSKYADEINSENWYEILARPDVKFGFSNPNDDPCGYRSVTLIGLASLFYNDDHIVKKLICEKTNIKIERKVGKLYIYVPGNLEDRAEDLVIRSKSVDLISLLEAGVIDYAFEYRSVAVQHGLKFIELPPQLNLGDPKYKDFYSKVIVYILYGIEKEKEIPGAPIVYGLTIPATVENYEDAIRFLKLLLSEEGRKVFESCGQPFLEKIFSEGEVPGELASG